MKWIVAFFFLLMIIVQGYYSISLEHGLSKTALLLSFLILTIFLVNRRLFWIAGILLFVYGTYALTILGTRSSAPLVLDFTYPLRFLMYGTSTDSLGSHLLKLISVGFYPVFLIVFLTTPVRRLYHISK